MSLALVSETKQEDLDEHQTALWNELVEAQERFLSGQGGPSAEYFYIRAHERFAASYSGPSNARDAVKNLCAIIENHFGKREKS